MSSGDGLQCKVGALASALFYEGNPLSDHASSYGRVTESIPRGRSGVKELGDSLIELILDLGLGPFDPLPTEPELMEQLGVGRGSLREAVKWLQARGILDVRHGTGTYVAEAQLQALGGMLAFRGRRSIRGDGREAREIIEVREALESGLIAAAIARMRPDDVERLLEVLDEMEQASADSDLSQLDARFHEALFLPLGNETLSQLLRTFWAVHDTLIADCSVTPAETVDAHRAIYFAVAARDPELAAKAIVDHFAEVKSRLSAYSVPTTAV